MFESVAQSAVALETVDQGAYGGDLVKGTRQVIRDQGSFDVFWNSLHGVSSGRTAPNIDFSSQTVLAVVLGTRPSGGYQVDIANVTRMANPALIQASVAETVPGNDCVVTQAVTVPYHFVTVDTRETDPITFPDEGAQTQSCTQ